MAATTLSGLLQCNFLTMDSAMQSHFEQLCKTKLPKKRKRDPGSVGDTIPSAGNVKNPHSFDEISSLLKHLKCLFVLRSLLDAENNCSYLLGVGLKKIGPEIKG